MLWSNKNTLPYFSYLYSGSLTSHICIPVPLLLIFVFRFPYFSYLYSGSLTYICIPVPLLLTFVLRFPYLYLYYGSLTYICIPVPLLIFVFRFPYFSYLYSGFQLQCCGNVEYNDWFSTAWEKKENLKNLTMVVPKSCCRVAEDKCKYFDLPATPGNATLDVHTTVSPRFGNDTQLQLFCTT